jgi:hypothetical protein
MKVKQSLPLVLILVSYSLMYDSLILLVASTVQAGWSYRYDIIIQSSLDPNFRGSASEICVRSSRNLFDDDGVTD